MYRVKGLHISSAQLPSATPHLPQTEEDAGHNSPHMVVQRPRKDSDQRGEHSKATLPGLHTPVSQLLV